ncbi:unnamed protein product [Cladocopium goreaui]|uniref:Uncharacterized protein n=1 Tax=Cladocopium goreaui TaxID=2562237 RepID=A0A9P1C674_9DINO|nr:unnamed protein product [Cladocopium goreaui]
MSCRFDDIEPHLQFCLEHADVVVPHLNEIVEYLDDILFFAKERPTSGELWLRLEPQLPQLVKRLPLLGPHLPSLRRHSELVTPFLPVLAPHCDRLVNFQPISQHADVLVHYLGWALRVLGSASSLPEIRSAFTLKSLFDPILFGYVSGYLWLSTCKVGQNGSMDQPSPIFFITHHNTISETHINNTQPKILRLKTWKKTI